MGLGTLDTVYTHAREIFRPAIVAAAHSLILAYNHPSGDPKPSDADLRTTRDLFRAGQLLKIDLKDHIIIGDPEHRSPPTVRLELCFRGCPKPP